MIRYAFQSSGREPSRPARPNPPPPRRREPVFNAPAPVLVLLALILGGYAMQSILPPEEVITRFAFRPAGLAVRWWTLFSALFLHGGWPHALMNAAFALAFGTPVARFLGGGIGGMAAFFGFYLTCGALSNLGFAALHPGGMESLVGASGAISGLMGAASRLLAGQGRLGRILAPPVIGMGAAWVAVNALIATLGSSIAPGSGGAPIAWEAHVAGFVAGLIVIGPVAWAMRRG